MVSRIKLVLFHVIFPLVLGSLIYIGFRSTDLKMFEWFSYTGISKFTDTIRGTLITYRCNLPKWFYYSLPDGFWTYSFSSAYLILWQKDLKMARYWLLLPFSFSCIVEVGQGLGFIRGTFDIVDLALCLLAIILSILIFNQSLFKYEKSQHIENYQ